MPWEVWSSANGTLVGTRNTDTEAWALVRALWDEGQHAGAFSLVFEDGTSPVLALTPEERAHLAEILCEQITVRRPEMEERLRRLRARGDALDEDEYDDALDEAAGLAGQISYLQRTLAQAEAISEDEARQADYVRVGRRVTVINDAGEETTYHVFAYARDRLQGGLSCQSPIGRALMGKRVGDTAVVTAPAGTFSLRVVRIDPTAV
jgi:transcription elongation factor GreA